MSKFDNAFINSFSKVMTAPQESELKEGQEDTPTNKGQRVTEVPISPEQQPLPEDQVSDVAEKFVRKRGRRRKGDGSIDGASADKVGHFSCICDKDLIVKVRAIAWQEHMTVRAVVEGMFSKSIAKYEKKRGPIQIEPSHSPEELF